MHISEVEVGKNVVAQRYISRSVRSGDVGSVVQLFSDGRAKVYWPTRGGCTVVCNPRDLEPETRKAGV